MNTLPNASRIPLLEISNLKAYYGNTQVLYNVNLSLQQGEIVSLMGRNGMGKSTTIRSILGLMPHCEGELFFNGNDLLKLQPNKIARLGIGWVPEGRRITPNLTVRENLLATQFNVTRDAANTNLSQWDLESVFNLFPRLRSRLENMGGQLSGGEQQMLAIGRALMTSPQLLILDEATEGLAPIMRQEIWQCLWQLKKQGMSIVIVDKNINVLCKLADRHFIIEKGCTVWNGTSSELSENPSLKSKFLSV
ncbi:MAG: ABC transporter ATP-binding protein [Moraxellaceae bacterium]|nr:MAG: ABC transporter ATP-binding protein [Moraxellaceae bacterium]